MRYVMLGLVCMLAVAFLCCCQQVYSNYGEELPVIAIETTNVQVAVVPVVAILADLRSDTRLQRLATTDAIFVNQTVDVPGGYAAGVCNATAAPSVVLRPVQFVIKMLTTVRPKGRLVYKVLNRNKVFKFPLLGRASMLKI